MYLNITVPSLNTAGQGIDEPLSETGFKQAAAAGLFLKDVKFTHVFSSDLIRTKQVSLVKDEARESKVSTVVTLRNFLPEFIEN